MELGTERTEYEPEFRALMYRDTECVVPIFSSSKLLVQDLLSSDVRTTDADIEVLAHG